MTPLTDDWHHGLNLCDIIWCTMRFFKGFPSFKKRNPL